MTINVPGPSLSEPIFGIQIGAMDDKNEENWKDKHVYYDQKISSPMRSVEKTFTNIDATIKKWIFGANGISGYSI